MFLWDGDVRWLVGLYISPSHRDNIGWSTRRGCRDELGAKSLHGVAGKRIVGMSELINMLSCESILIELIPFLY